MTDERSQKLKAFFDEAIDLPREKQAAFIDERCGDDDELRARLLRILEHDSTLRDQEARRSIACGISPAV